MQIFRLIASHGLTALACCAVHAQNVDNPSVYVEIGPSGERKTATASVGGRVPWQRWGEQGQFVLALDFYVSRWRVSSRESVRTNVTQLGIVPMWRWRFDAGRSAWYVEAGIGLSYLTDDYRSGRSAFSTRWNFSDHLGVGRSFGAQHQHRLGVYVKHVSNGGLRKPNPGETFWMLRYDYGL